MVSKTSWLETEGTRRLPYHGQRLAGAVQGGEARPESLLLQQREFRSSRCGRQTQSRRPHAQARKTGACILPIRTASNVRSRARDTLSEQQLICPTVGR